MRKRREPINNINVVPYLDVLLVLLVIFMITAPLFHQGVVDLPSVGDADVRPPSNRPIVVRYAADAESFSLHDTELGEEEVEDLGKTELVERVESILLLRPDAAVVLEADKNLPLGEVTSLIGELREAGAKNVGLQVKTGDKQ